MFNEKSLTGLLCNSTSAVHRNSSELSTLLLVISGLNVALSMTATLGNALILVAFHRELSLNPPSKLFLRCLAFSDLSVGLLVQPVGVVSLLTAFYHRWNLSSCRAAMVFLQHTDGRIVSYNFHSDQRRQTSCAIVRYQV